MSQPPIDPERIADDTARHLLRRAAALDDSHLTLAQLREAAGEAGISNAAFDAAVAEWRRSPSAERASHRSPLQAVGRNVASFAVATLATVGFATVDRLTGAPWLVHKFTDPLSLAIGAAVAVKLRARTAAVVLGGLAVAFGAEFIMDLISGAPAIHGSGAHWGLIIAGVAGVVLGHRFLRPPRGRAERDTPPGVSDAAEKSEPPRDDARRQPLRSTGVGLATSR